MIASTSAFEIGVGFAGAAPAAAVDDAPEAGAAAAVIRRLREHVAADGLTTARVFGETLPEGLRIE